MKTLRLNTRQGGLGDVWMRLVGAYSLAGITTGCSFEVQVPGAFEHLAQACFGDRLRLVSAHQEADYTYTSLGARSLLPKVASGQRFVTPYSSYVSSESHRSPWADGVNQRVIQLLDAAKLVRSPRPENIHRYQAYSDIEPFARDLGVPFSAFLQQCERDFTLVRGRLQAMQDAAAVLGRQRLNADKTFEVLVFPSGTSRQCMPRAWASANLPKATFAFFHKDALKAEYQAAGLECVDFYADPADMVALAFRAQWSISTDSFASHLLQYLGDRCTILLTELASVRVVSPFFKGRLVQSRPSCYPCRKTVRGPNSSCQAGHVDCLNWTDPAYAASARQTIESAPHAD